MKDFLYMMNSTSIFHQFGNKKVLKLETFYVLMSIATFFGAMGVGYDTVNGLDFSNFYYASLSLFILSAIMRVVAVEVLNPAPKEIQDKYWETQLMRFKDPKHAIQKELYGNYEERELVLEQLWLEKYGVTVEYTIANAPKIMKVRILLLFLAGIIGLATGYYIVG
jgi:hypothetical protein